MSVRYLKQTGVAHAGSPRRRKVVGAAVISGLMLAGAFPHLDCCWLVWPALVPLLLTLPYVRLRTAVAQSFMFGMVYLGGIFYWLVVVGYHSIGIGLGLLAWAIASIAQTLAMLAFGAGAWFLHRHPNRWAWRLGVPALWTVLEWLRQLGQLGVSWGDLACSQHACLPVLQLSKLTGGWGISFLIVLVNVALAEAFEFFSEGVCATSRVPLVEGGHSARGGSFGVGVLVVVAAVVVYGFVVMKTDRLRPAFIAAALQTDVNPNLDYTPMYVQQTMAQYLAQGDAAGSAGAKIVVWPEATFPGYLRDDTGLAGEITTQCAAYDMTALVGSSERGIDGHDANSLIDVTPDGVIGASYVKRHLVPFGEYVPYRRWLPFLDALHMTVYDREVGAPVQGLLQTPVGPVAAAICYESSYPELMREQVARGAEIIAIVTDDTWYGQTAAPAQHAAFAALRAAETDRYAIRAAATGISEIIDPTGRVVASAPLYTERVLIGKVEGRTTVTPYVRFGDWFIWACLLVLAATGLDAVFRS